MTRTTLPLLLLIALSACGGGSSEAPSDGPSSPPDQSTAPATFDRSAPPEPGEARPFDLPEPQRIVLENGLEVIVIERPGFPSVAARLSIRAGYDASPDAPAVAELLGRTLMEGTEAMDAAAIARRVDASGVALSVSASPNRVVIAGSGVSTTTDAMLSIMGELVNDATFPTDRVEARRDEFVDELALSASQPSYHANRQIRRVLFGEHVYGTTISPDDVGSVDAADIRALYSATFGPERAQLVLVGRVPDDLEALLESSFGTWTRDTSAWTAPTPTPISTCNEAHVVLRPESAQTAIRWVGPATDRTAADYFPSLVANQVLGGGPSARLFMNLREDKSYTYGAYSGMQHMIGASYFSASADVRSDVTSGALAEFRYEFDRLADDSIEADELTEAIDYLAGVYPIELERNSAIAGRVSELLASGLSIDFLTDYRSNVRGVDLFTANDAAANMANAGAMTLIMVGVEDIVVPSATGFASHVYVYDLDGELVRQLEGQVERRCTY